MQNDQKRSLIVGFVADLMFTTRIQNVIERLGFQVKWVETAVQIGTPDPNTKAEGPSEKLHGVEGKLFAIITDWQPVLLIFDLDNNAIPWQRWIPLLKSSPATRRMPIMCFGSHVKVDAMTEAKRVGADVVLARSRFTSAMPKLIQQYARVPDLAALQTFCEQPLPGLARQGIEKFNQGQYYDCHDDLEEAWRQDNSVGRNLYQGILQVGIALHQVKRGNYRGAVKMLLRSRQWLDALPDYCRGVNIAQLRENSNEIYEAVQALGSNNLAEFDWSIVKPIALSEG